MQRNVCFTQRNLISNISAQHFYVLVIFYIFFLARCYKLKHMLRVVFVGWLKTKSEK